MKRTWTYGNRLFRHRMIAFGQILSVVALLMAVFTASCGSGAAFDTDRFSEGEAPQCKNVKMRDLSDVPSGVLKTADLVRAPKLLLPETLPVFFIDSPALTSQEEGRAQDLQRRRRLSWIWASPMPFSDPNVFYPAFFSRSDAIL